MIDPIGPVDPVLVEQIKQAEQAFANAENVRDNAENARDNAQLVYDKAKEPVDYAQLAVDNANDAIKDRQADLSVQEGYRTEWNAANSNIRRLQQSLEDLIFGLSESQLDSNIETSLTAIKLRELRKDIDLKRDEVEKLEKEGVSSEVTALVGGIIKTIAAGVSPGRPAPPNEVLMTIEVVDRGYSLNLAVTAEQASRVSPGDMAEVDRGWWSWEDDITATLIGIRNNPENPATGRLLHFAVAGNVESGSTLNLTLAQRSESYSTIVPNSAIRTDTNGDFVLVVMSSTGPLGNRYIATRADINILAADDTHTAVTGGLSGWDFVITTSTAPIDPGMQVRLVDNP